MTVSPGTRLGPYEIGAPIGSGGMGDVYRARDVALGRDVAIKVLPPAFAADADRVARFTREAQALASLNHPNVAQIYGVVQEGPTRALAMELVEGDDLARRLARGPLPVDEAVAIGRQIAEALDEAHERGIVHRDLKPANIKVRDDGVVKVLDFGLAKAMAAAPAGSAPDLAASPTFTSPAMTALGVIIGTAAYMSPEQAKGKPVDRRADIWAFGAVLYEMLAGEPAFAGETVTDVLAAVVTREPVWDRLPAATPPPVVRLLRRCLERDPRRRLRDIGDAQHELTAGVVDTAPAAPARLRPGWRAAVAAAALVALTAAGTWMLARPPAPPPLASTRFVLSGLPLLYDPFQALALSPDGRTFAFRGGGPNGVPRLFVRQLGSLQVSPLEGTDGARLPFFSPDGQSLAFFADGSLKRIPLAGGAARVIARAAGATGGTWLDDGTIVMAAGSTLQRVAADGGQPENVLPLGSDVVQASSPWGLPGSRAVLVTVRRGATHDLVVVTLADGAVRPVVSDAYNPIYAASGHVLFQQANEVLAVPFDAATLAPTGAAFLVLPNIAQRLGFQTRLFALAADGTLVYLPRMTAEEAGWGLAWLDRKGAETPITRFERPLDTPRLSPDGSRVAFRVPATNCDAWLHDLARGIATRLTHEGDNHGLAWSPDGTRVAVARVVADGTEILVVPADGSGPGERLAALGRRGEEGAAGAWWPTSWSPSGMLLLQDGAGGDAGIDVYGLEPGKAPAALIASRADDVAARFSPDGRFVAYVSDESGRQEVYIRAASGQGARVQVSSDGGLEPMWSPSGRELLFRSGRAFLAIPTELRDVEVVVGRPQVLFAADLAFGPAGLANYDVARDGRVLIAKGGQWAEGQAVVVLNWPSEWKGVASGTGR
jgi:eukaryotic-like serine/threonine-protein kinase